MDGKKTGPETLSIVLSLIFLGNSPQEIEDIFEIEILTAMLTLPRICSGILPAFFRD